MEKLTQQQIKALPTLLDIMEEISSKEEINNCDNSMWGMLMFNKSGYEDKFELDLCSDGWYLLRPISLNRDMCYRGQSKVYTETKSSIYRSKSEEAFFRANLYATEFALLLLTHPIISFLANGIEIPLIDDKPQTCKIKVDLYGLAQHYGLETEILDFSTDKWVAAFFASTDYIKGKYLPVLSTNRYGAFYLYSSNLAPFENRMYPVGLQPFPRPGEQHAYGLILKKDESLESIDRINCWLFRHDPKIAELIFNYSNRSNKLFPNDLLVEKSNQLKKQKKISKRAFQETLRIYYNETDSKRYLQVCESEGIILVDNPIIRFTEKEKNEFCKKWDAGLGKDFLEKIIYRPVYTNLKGLEDIPK